MKDGVVRMKKFSERADLDWRVFRPLAPHAYLPARSDQKLARYLIAHSALPDVCNGLTSHSVGLQGRDK